MKCRMYSEQCSGLFVVILLLGKSRRSHESDSEWDWHAASLLPRTRIKHLNLVQEEGRAGRGVSQKYWSQYKTNQNPFVMCPHA